MADKSTGWVPLYRSILEHWIWNKDDKYSMGQAWVDLLLNANHADKKVFFEGKLITIKRGQMLTSIKKLSERWKWDTKRTRNFLNALECDEMVTTERTTHGTTVTIINYEDFNNVGTTDGTTKGTTKGQPRVRPRDDRGYDRGTTEGRPRDTNNNDNNDNNDNNVNNENNVTKREGRKKQPLSRFGEYQLVKMTEDEHNKLLDQLGEHDTTEYIKRVDEYCKRTGKRYQDYYLTILNWYRKDHDGKQEETTAERVKRLLREGGVTE